jgi:hypothetical protein
MKFVSKFPIRTSSSMARLCSPWSWHVVRVRSSIFCLDKSGDLIILAVIFVVMILAADRNTLACHAV